MAFLGSNNITMFPSAGRNPANDATSRLTTEYNLVNIVNRLVTTKEDGFVITDKIDSDVILEFCIDGYYFKVDNYNDIITAVGGSPTDIYAYINVNTNNGVAFSELAAWNNAVSTTGYPLDIIVGTSEQFAGVEFRDSEISSENVEGFLKKHLHILTKVGNDWKIPKESQVRYIIESPMGKTPTLYIDDGELEETTSP